MTVDVFQQSVGRRVLGNRLVARFRNRGRSFTWSGQANRRGRRVTDGVYAVRFRSGRDSGRLALRRSGGRFAARPDYAVRPGCGPVRLFKFERPVLGGRSNRSIGIALRLDRDAQVTVRVRSARQTVRTFRLPSVRAGRLVRLRLPSERLRRGDVRAILEVTTPSGTVRRTLLARRL